MYDYCVVRWGIYDRWDIRKEIHVGGYGCDIIYDYYMVRLSIYDR